MKAEPVDNIRECFDTLGLAPGASKDAVKEAYRDLAKVWHPDRFGGDERLAQKAQDKLKDINAAYTQIQAFLANHDDPAGEEPASPASSFRVRPMEEQPPTPHPFPNLGKSVMLGFGAMAAFGVVGLIIVLMSIAEAKRVSSEQDLQYANEEARLITNSIEAKRRTARESAEAAGKARAVAQARQEAANRRKQELEAMRAADNARLRTNSVAANLSLNQPATDAGNFYQMGLKFSQGSQADDKEANKWFMKAAELGHAEAEHKLAFNYSSGRGVERDDVEAYKWFTLAARHGEATAIQNRTVVERRMTPEQIEDAMRRALKFIEHASAGGNGG